LFNLELTRYARRALVVPLGDNMVSRQLRCLQHHFSPIGDSAGGKRPRLPRADRCVQKTAQVVVTRAPFVSGVATWLCSLLHMA